MKFLFQMDDPKKINISEDSTYMIIKESLNRGIECFYNDPNWVYADINRKNKIKSHIFRIFLKDNGTLTYDIKNKINVDLENFSAIFIRQDPPYDMKYISNTYLLEKLKKPMVINNPSELRNFPEKHIMMNFPDLTPSTIISSKEIMNFTQTLLPNINIPNFKFDQFDLDGTIENNNFVINSLTLNDKETVLETSGSINLSNNYEQNFDLKLFNLKKSKLLQFFPQLSDTINLIPGKIINFDGFISGSYIEISNLFIVPSGNSGNISIKSKFLTICNTVFEERLSAIIFK